MIPSAAGRPGTSLGDGFEVTEGTTLIGDPIPIGVAVVYRGEPIVDDGWTADLLVDGGDPLAIVETYLEQAADAGLVPVVEPGCRADRGEGVVVCSGAARSLESSPPRSLTVEVVRGRRGDVYSDHVVVRYATTELYWETPAVWYGGEPTTEVPDPQPWPTAPNVGEPLGTAGETMTSVIVEEGSRLAGPTRLQLDDATGGVVAILEVTGDPASVLESYLDQLVARGLQTGEPEVRQIGDATLTTAWAAESGGDGFQLSLVERPERPVWLQISGSHD